MRLAMGMGGIEKWGEGMFCGRGSFNGIARGREGWESEGGRSYLYSEEGVRAWAGQSSRLRAGPAEATR